jgi:hypothetical protein
VTDVLRDDEGGRFSNVLESLRMASIPDKNPNPAPAISNQGAVPHRLSAHHPTSGGAAI